MKSIYERAVAYLNVDYACDYHYVLVAGLSPLLQDALYHSAKKVPNKKKKCYFYMQVRFTICTWIRLFVPRTSVPQLINSLL